MLSNAPEHDWVEYNQSKGPKSFPSRKPARLCRICGVAERRDGSHPPCIDLAVRPTPPVRLKELR